MDKQVFKSPSFTGESNLMAALHIIQNGLLLLLYWTIKNLFGVISLDSGTYPAVKENHQKAKANEDNQCHKQETSHHGEVILS